MCPKPDDIYLFSIAGLLGTHTHTAAHMVGRLAAGYMWAVGV